MMHVADQSDNESLLQKFLVLKTAPRELWLTYFGKVMETIAYALVNMGLMLYLINDLHFSDQGAGTFVGIWATAFSLCSFLVGSLSDALGIRKTLIYAFTACVVFRVASSLLGHPVLSPVLGLMPLAFASAMTLPVMVAATRRFTNKKQSSMAFSLLYVFMNVGFAIAGKLFDVIRRWMGQEGTLRLPLVGLELSVYETIFLLAAGFTLLGLIPFLTHMRPGLEMPDDGDVPILATSVEEKVAGGLFAAMWDVLKKTAAILASVVREANFYRFILLLSIVVGVRMVFYHMHYTLPPWADRELGYGSRFGTAWGFLNPALIVILTPIFGALTQRISPFKMIVIGTSISALTCFLLVLPTDTFTFLVHTPFGNLVKSFLGVEGELAPLYITLVLFAATFSVGEALWSPRLYEYTASVAPKGRESTYMGLSLLPLFLGKLIVGPLSGVLISRYCPAEGARQAASMWLVVASMAAATPLLLVLLRRVVTPRSQGNTAEVAS